MGAGAAEPRFTRPLGYAVDVVNLDDCSVGDVCTDYWETVRGAFGSDDTWTYVRFSSGTPSDYSLRVAPKDEPAILLSGADGVVVKDVEVFASHRGIELTQHSDNSLVDHVLVRHSPVRIMIRSGSGNNTIRNVEATLDFFGDPEFGAYRFSMIEAIDNHTTQARRRYLYGAYKTVQGTASSDDAGVVVDYGAGAGNIIENCNIHHGLRGIDLNAVESNGLVTAQWNYVANPSGQKTHPYRDINILSSIVCVTMPLYFASNEA